MNNKVSSFTLEEPRRGFGKLEYRDDWSTGLFNCCSDCKLCCMGFFCLPCLDCIIFTDAREYIGTAYSFNSLANLRTKIRSTYGIKGSIDGDAAAAFCCHCCTAIQIKKELRARGEIKD